MHTAERIASAGHGGQILTSVEVASTLKDRLEPLDLALRDLGEHQLMDVDGLKQLYQIVIPELPSDFPALSSLATRPNNLPAITTPVADHRELADRLRDLLLAGDIRLVTLVGPGGAGKTRLALTVATELVNYFEAGAFLVPMASLKKHELVPATIAATLGIPQADNVPIIDCIADALREKEMLLVIDGFEHVRAAARQISAVLSACPGLTVIVTSREVVNLSAAHTIAVPPFEHPQPE